MIKHSDVLLFCHLVTQQFYRTKSRKVMNIFYFSVFYLHDGQKKTVNWWTWRWSAFCISDGATVSQLSPVWASVPGRSDVTAVSSVPSARCCPPQRVSDAPRRGRAAFGLFEAATPRPPCGRSRGRTPLYISRMIIKTVTYGITGRQYTPGGGGVTFLSELQRASRSDRETMSQI